ncbi:MAG: DUF721 domain-containing protein [Pirellulales bacterium]|nr:DUF721 domain-containing protein [Pirellulales bacterium]
MPQVPRNSEARLGTPEEADFRARREREQSRYRARKPRSIRDVVAQLIAARGYGRIQADADFAATWKGIVGEPLAQYTQPGRVRRGMLEVTAANSMTIQELTFQKTDILRKLQAELPEAKIRDLKIRVGSIS